MDWTQFIKIYLISIPVFFGIDMLWLGVIAKDFYAKNLGYIMAPKPNWTAAIIFYFIYLIGITIFAVMPAVEKNSFFQAVILGGLFGMIAYATYDLTNLAVLKNWPLNLTIIDIVWGTVLSASVASITYFVFTKWVA